MKLKIVSILSDFTTGIKKVEAESIHIGGIPCFIFAEIDDEYWGTVTGWNVSHVCTGFRICSDLDKKAAIAKAKKLVHTKKFDQELDRALEILKQNNIKFPVN